MATITELKKHLENGGKIRRPCWGKRAYIFLYDDELTEVGGLFYSNKELLLDDWVIYGELKNNFEITHIGMYETRAGKKVFVNYIDQYSSTYAICGVIAGERNSNLWSRSGRISVVEETPDDIVAEWED